tara:strand:- start:2169 stop:2687 length:519 start_codon:yes stop_codon:yes gene_type:complete
MITKIKPSLISFDKKIQNLCKIPYYGHAKGCPNFGVKEGCPPNQLLINGVLDFDKNIYLIYTKFCVGHFAETMREKHPEWEGHPRQWYNPRRWQSKARKLHKNEEEAAREKYRLNLITRSPEAHGVDVTKMMASVGVDLDWGWPPKHNIEDNGYLDNFVHIVSLGGTSFISK